jgi:hypothetical protein
VTHSTAFANAGEAPGPGFPDSAESRKALIYAIPRRLLRKTGLRAFRLPLLHIFFKDSLLLWKENVAKARYRGRARAAFAGSGVNQFLTFLAQAPPPCVIERLNGSEILEAGCAHADFFTR